MVLQWWGFELTPAQQYQDHKPDALAGTTLPCSTNDAYYSWPHWPQFISHKNCKNYQSLRRTLELSMYMIMKTSCCRNRRQLIMNGTLWDCDNPRWIMLFMWSLHMPILFWKPTRPCLWSMTKIINFCPQ